ncbi:MAG TPA: NIPSNAP family protein [Dehalococcoidia bacterium]|nr:NIPSNAP family protein [Dehalococcoidia bacterium]
MIYEVRTYTLKPGSTPEVEKRWADALPARLKLSPLTAFFKTEIGPLNQIIHIWEYENLEERGRIREEAIRQKIWPPKASEFILNMQSEIMLPAPFMQPIKPAEIGPIFEWRTYTYQPGAMPKVLERWAQSVPDRIKVSPLAACWYSELGSLNRFIHVWAYRDLNDRTERRAKGMELPNWPPQTREWLVAQENKIVVPADFSPLK